MARYESMTEADLEDMLTRKYNYLVRHISPREFIPPLISKHVINQSDKEEIQGQITSIDRAGTARSRALTEQVLPDHKY